MAYERYYEKNPTVKKAVTLLFKFPPDIKSVLARGFCAIAENDFDAHILLQDLKSLGQEKVLALYKSNLKRREYDHDPYLSRAMNYLMILSPDNQFFLASKVLEMMAVVRDYMVLCKKYSTAIQQKLVEKITRIYVTCGLEEAAEFVSQVRREFEHLVARAKIGKSQLLPSDLLPSESITSENTGMRIRPNLDFT
jgi:hypothetical protein